MIASPPPRPDTLADLVFRLGGVPLDRIRLTPPPGTATEADLAAYRGPTCELIDGTLVEKAMGDRESAVGMYLGHLILAHIHAADLGIVLGEAGHIRVAPNQLRAPDVTFLPWDVLPDGEMPDEAYWAVAPAFVAEVLSRDNTPAEIDRKLAEFFRAGCRLAWVIDPRRRTARVYTSATAFDQVDEAGVLDGRDVLPGLRVPVAELLAVGHRRRP